MDQTWCIAQPQNIYNFFKSGIHTQCLTRSYISYSRHSIFIIIIMDFLKKKPFEFILHKVRKKVCYYLTDFNNKTIHFNPVQFLLFWHFAIFYRTFLLQKKCKERESTFHIKMTTCHKYSPE